MPVDEGVVQSLRDKAAFKECLGREKNYPNFLEFFQREIEAKGVERVLRDYVFAGDERAESMLARLFGGMLYPLPFCSGCFLYGIMWELTRIGLLHPIIHLGFAIEFNQPAIIAEALAQTAIHEDWTGPRFLWPVEKAAGGVGKPGKKTMSQLLEEARADKKLAKSATWEDGNKLRDGVLKRAPEEMINCAAQFTVSEEQVQAKFAEMVDMSGKYTAFELSRLGGRANYGSLLHKRSPTSLQSRQIRLLLHPHRQLVYLLFQDPRPPIPRPPH